METSKSCARLRVAPLLSALDETDLNDVADAVTWLDVAPGQEVVSHLSADGDLYFVSDGVLQAKLVSPIGRVVSIRRLGPGSHFGEIAALTGALRTVSIAAESKALLARCPKAVFIRLMGASAKFGQAVAAHLARTVVQLTDRVYELAALEVRFRIYGELLRLAKRGASLGEGVRIEAAPTHEAIASAIGAQREVVTKELRMLAQEGVLRRERRALIICDVNHLRALYERRAGASASQAVDWII